MATKSNIESLLQGYIDNELSPGELAIFERELSKNAELRELLEQQRETAAVMFEALGAHRQNGDLVSTVMSHLPEMEGSNAYTAHDTAQDVNWRAKHPRASRFRFLTFAPTIASMLLVVLGFAILYAWPPALPESRALIGMVTGSWDDVLFHDGASLQTQAASLMHLVREGDEIETGDKGSALVALSGPTFVKIDNNSRFRATNSRTVKMYKGKMWLNVAKHNRKFRVQTPEGTVTVFGTTFGVEVLPGRVIVTLEEGEVTVENGEDFVVLYPGEQANVFGDTKEIEKSAVDAASMLAWAKGIQSDPLAMREFHSVIRPLQRSVLYAEQVWWVDIKNFEGEPHALTLSWSPLPEGKVPLDYDMLVYDENMSPLFSRRLHAETFAKLPHTAEVSIPTGSTTGSTTAFVRLVPDVNHGQYEVDFGEVAVIGAQ